MKATLKKITPFISIVFFGLALWFLDHELRQHDMGEVLQQLRQIPNMYIVLSVILSFLSYLLLTVYDGLGVKYIGEKLSPGKIIRAGFIGYAFSHNIGFALITGGSIRYRIYSAWGLSVFQVTQIVAFSAFTLWIGFCSVAGLSLLFATPNLPDDVALPFESLRVLGIILLLMVVAYIWASAVFKEQLSFRGWKFNFPDVSLSVRQVVLASADWLMAALVLYVLLPPTDITFFSFVGVFLLAQIIGLFSQVPGGLGVFESVMLLYLSNFMAGSTVIGILLVYRIIYYILPLLTAMILLGYQEYQENRKTVKELGEKAADWFPRVVPQVLSISILIGGAMLLFSGAMPSQVTRMQWLRHFIPLPVIEMSHFLASLVGAALLVLSDALQRRIDGAYHLTVGLLVFGILFSLLKGADYEEASVLAVMLVALIPCRDEFHRKASLFSKSYSPKWIAMIMIVIFSFLWLGIFSYRHIEYQNELWWRFSLMADAPRYLRAMVAVLGFSLIIGLVKLLRPRPVSGKPPELHELETAEEIVKESPHANAGLALLGDKELLFNEEQNAFIMYGIEGRSWISMGDPVGPADTVENLLWKYQEVCDEYDAWPVFYQVRSDYLNFYVDLGLSRLKLGEEARVFLPEYDPVRNLESDMREHNRQLEKEGYCWELLSHDRLPEYFETLRTISDRCLEMREQKERGFSVGYFDESYLQRSPVSVVRSEGEIVAFSNLLAGNDRYELTIDLLRHRPESSDRVIDYLVTKNLEWGKRQNYRWFNLGMAPLSGMNDRDFTSRWNKMADLIYTYGDNFYRFQAVREYKNKFSPQWEPRYLACPGGIALPRILSNLTNLVTSGIKGLVR